MKYKKVLLPLLFVILSAAVMLFDWQKNDLLLKIKGGGSLGSSMIFGLIEPTVYLIYVLLGMGTIVYAVLMLKKVGWSAILPSIIFLATLFFVFVFPVTRLYLNWNHAINKANREKIVSMAEEGLISEYQIGPDKYVVPFRSTSYTGAMIVHNQDDVLTVEFFVYRGLLGEKLIVYVSDDSGLNDFEGYKNIEKLSDGWYTADK